MKFSILVVCLNPGEKLGRTVQSILEQTYTDYEILVKDGGSIDNSLALLPEDSRIRLVQKKDTGIYDAMNQAALEAEGEYVYFLNCGDYFHDERVLEKLAEALNLKTGREESGLPGIVYGNIFDRLTNSMVSSNPSMDAFGCYRNVPCHQACFYRRELVLEHPFSLVYKVRADYEQFLWCFFQAKTTMLYVPLIIADYEGGGFSESSSSLKKSQEEHKQITALYMTKSQLLRYRLTMLLTLAGFRTYLSHHPVWGKLYNKMKKRIYHK